MKKIILTFYKDNKHQEIIRRLIHKSTDLNENTKNKLIVVLDELISNAIAYGMKNSDDKGEIHLTISRSLITGYVEDRGFLKRADIKRIRNYYLFHKPATSDSSQRGLAMFISSHADILTLHNVKGHLRVCFSIMRD